MSVGVDSRYHAPRRRNQRLIPCCEGTRQPVARAHAAVESYEFPVTNIGTRIKISATRGAMAMLFPGITGCRSSSLLRDR